MLWSLVKVRKYQCFFQSCFREAKGKMNWPATRMSGETCVHSARAYSKAMHTIPTFFVPNHEKPQPFYFEGNMQSQIVPSNCSNSLLWLRVTALPQNSAVNVAWSGLKNCPKPEQLCCNRRPKEVLQKSVKTRSINGKYIHGSLEDVRQHTIHKLLKTKREVV